MYKKTTRTFAVGAALLAGALSGIEFSPSVVDVADAFGNGSASVARAQNGGNNGNRRGNRNNRNGRNGRNGGRPGGPGGPGQNGGPNGGRPDPAQTIANMNADRFGRIKSGPFGARLREQVGEEVWTRWENGDFSGNPSVDAMRAQLAQSGELTELKEMTDEEKAEAEALLKAGTVPNFAGKEGEHYSQKSEEEYYQRSLARRDDSLVPAAPISLRFYSRYLISKYDENVDGALEREEWENKLEGAQAVDLDGDWTLTDQEILFYLARFAKGRTIFNPIPPRTPEQRRNSVVVSDDETEILIRPASAAPKRETAEEAEAADKAEENALADMSEDEAREMLKDENPALESVDDPELLDALLSDMDESSVREYAAPRETLLGVPAWFLARDANGDGQLTLREFAPTLSTPAVAYFGKLDANADGFITADEVRQAVGAQRR